MTATCEEKSSYGYRGPSIDHTILSPSGRVSKAARNAALKREAARLFPEGFWTQPTQSTAEQAREKATQLRRSASNLRDLAARGMNARKYTREAVRMEAQAAALEST